MPRSARRIARTIVVTGASAGVGRAVVRQFARDGARIALIARGVDGLRATAAEVEATGAAAMILPLDVADAAAVDAAAAQIVGQWGDIDIWVNAAFAGVLAPFLSVTARDYQRVTEVTYLGQVNGTRAALRYMRQRGQGVIVLVGSALAYRGIPLQSAYCGAKHAIQGFQDSLRAELAHDKIDVHVTMVQLPGVNTPQFDWIKTTLPRCPKPASPPYQPEVAARAILFASRVRRKEIRVGLPTLMAIWGDWFASAWLDRYLGRTGYASQQDQMAVAPGRVDNLWAPVAGDHGAHGRFDQQARRHSLQLWLTMHGCLTAAGLAVLLALLVWLLLC